MVTRISPIANIVVIPGLRLRLSTAKSIRGLANHPNCPAKMPTGPKTKIIQPAAFSAFAQSRTIRGFGLLETAGRYSDQRKKI
jgi:hypothetical protein